MSRTLTEIRSIARSHTRTAISVLAGIMNSKTATPAARLAAAIAILDRGWGRPQPMGNAHEDRKAVRQILRFIVDSENSDSPGV